MAVTPICAKIENQNQPSLKQKKVAPSYLQATGAVHTEDLVKPLPGKGYLIHDNLGSGIKYFFKDIAYDMKSLKNGIKGTANDHQSGRLNDVGLRLGGIGIAAYLASRTTSLKARLMEYVGLVAFLTSMSIFPKIAINKPAEIMHGFDIDKEYIDDQGRKKSVHQDSNYKPYDLYRGEIKSEDLDKIGDRLGIPRDAKNRHDLVKEQMNKIATQNNTLWMLTAGFATPVMAALGCFGLEYLVGPGAVKFKNINSDKKINQILEYSRNMEMNVENLNSNELSKKVNSILEAYKNKALPKEEFEKLIETLTYTMDEKISSGIEKDITVMLRKSSTGSENIMINAELVENMINKVKAAIPNQHAEALKDIIPTAEQIKTIIDKIQPNADLANGAVIGSDDIVKIKEELANFINSKIPAVDADLKDGFNAVRNEALASISKALEESKAYYLTEESFNEILNFSKIMGDFKKNFAVLDNCKHVKFEHATDTVIANYYGKFERALFKELGISYKDMQKMASSDRYAKEILDEKLKSLAKDEAKYTKAVQKLSKVMSEMEVALHGSSESESAIQKLIEAFENIYNNTAKRLNASGKFKETIDMLVKEDISTLGNSVTTREQVFDFLDGILFNEFKNLDIDGWDSFKNDGNKVANYLKNKAKGAGSSKNDMIDRMVERYSGSKNSFNRILHTLDLYRRALDTSTLSTDSEKARVIIEKAKDVLLNASTSDFTQKLDMRNNPEFYKEFIDKIWSSMPEQEYFSTKAKGFVTETTQNAIGKEANLANGNILERFQYYITRFRNVIGNSAVDFTQPEHRLNKKVASVYTQSSKTPANMFNLLGQTPVDMAHGAAKRMYNTQTWLRRVGGIGVGVLGVTLLAQLGFGKIRNPHNIQKQVSDEKH